MSLLAVAVAAFLAGPVPELPPIPVPGDCVIAELRARPDLHWYNVWLPDSVSQWPAGATIQVTLRDGVTLAAVRTIGFGARPGGKIVRLAGPVDHGRLEHAVYRNHGSCWRVLAGFGAPVSGKVERVELVKREVP